MDFFIFILREKPGLIIVELSYSNLRMLWFVRPNRRVFWILVTASSSPPRSRGFTDLMSVSLWEKSFRISFYSMNFQNFYRKFLKHCKYLSSSALPFLTSFLSPRHPPSSSFPLSPVYSFYFPFSRRLSPWDFQISTLRNGLIELSIKQNAYNSWTFFLSPVLSALMNSSLRK